jgi:hypothetical protein
MALPGSRLSNTDRVSFTNIPRTCFLLILLCAAFAASAQDTTRVVKVSTRFFTERDLNRNTSWQQIDTQTNRLEIFQHTFRNYIVFQDLGNFGTPARPLLFDVNRNTGFQYALNPMAVYFFDPEQAEYINTRTPYTDLFYAQGPEEMRFIRAKHSQNITPRWNVGLDYQRITSQGFLVSQYTSMFNVQGHTSFQSRNKRYHLVANTTWNRALMQENGGVTSDSVFAELPLNSKQMPMKLANAQSRIHNRSIRVKQYWNMGSAKYQYRDDDTLYDYRSSSHIAYTIHAEDTRLMFTNKGRSDSTLIPHQYFDTGSETYDSAYFGKIENRIEFNLFTDRDRQLEDSVRRFLGGGITHQQIAVAQVQFIRNYHNVIADLTFENMAAKNNTLSVSAYGALTVSGFNSGDMKATGSVRYRLPYFDLSANGLIQLYRPDFTSLYFRSNQFIWNNSFDRTAVTQVGGTLTTRTWRHNAQVKVNQFAIKDQVYFGTDATPKQMGGTIYVTTATLSKTIQAWKFFFEHELIWQNSSSDVIRLPEFGGMARYYFASRLFKVMKFQLGFSVYYNTAYYSNAYNPASRQFYLQNEVRTGNYPLIDPFVTGEIKRASFFVKMEHVNQGWINQGYYYTPHYPISLQSLRLGIRWRFYD